MSFSDADIKAVLKAAAAQCDFLGSPLTPQQRQVLQQVMSAHRATTSTAPDPNLTTTDQSVAEDATPHLDSDLIPDQPDTDSTNENMRQQAIDKLESALPDMGHSESARNLDGRDDGADNPLDEMTPEHRSAFLAFIQRQSHQTENWKTSLLNDWLSGSSSGELQFIRDFYGPQWLNRVQATHLAKYLDPHDLKLKVGDQIEVSNGLWEWVQDSGPCLREWILCTVIALRESEDDAFTTPDSYRQFTTCTVRFENGREFEIQGVYEWNRYSWRWPEPD
ncbi:MAG: hypothetical protein ACTS2F_24920 [Thainema sp.]